MHKIVMWLGGITAAIGVLVFGMILMFGGSQRGAALLGALGIGGGLILSGAILYCFGAIVDHLIAIRAAIERQVEIFSKLGQPKA